MHVAPFTEGPGEIGDTVPINQGTRKILDIIFLKNSFTFSLFLFSLFLSPSSFAQSPCSLEELMLKMKLQHCGHLMQITDTSEKTLLLGKNEGRMRRGNRGWDGWIASPTQQTWVWANSLRLKDMEAWHASIHGVKKSQTWLSNWTKTTTITKHNKTNKQQPQQKAHDR